jgi:hypothetical protein
MTMILDHNFTADGTTDSVNLNNIRGLGENIYTVCVYGSTFGSGTVTVTVSPNDGSTDIPLLDSAGTALTFTANGIRNFLLNSDPQNPLSVSAALTGSANPNVNIRIFRNN